MINGINPTLPRFEMLLPLPSTDFASMKLKGSFIEGFCENVGDLVICAHCMDGQKSGLYMLAKVVILYIKMLGAWTHLGYFGHFDGAGVVLDDFAVNCCALNIDLDVVGFGFSEEVNEMYDLPRNSG